MNTIETHRKGIGFLRGASIVVSLVCVAHFAISVFVWGSDLVNGLSREEESMDWGMYLHAIPAVLLLAMSGFCLAWAMMGRRGYLGILLVALAAIYCAFRFDIQNRYYQKEFDRVLCDCAPQRPYNTWWWYASAIKYQIRHEKFGMIDKDGAWLIEPKFALLTRFSDGVALAIQDGKWGLIDRNGYWVLEPIFERARGYSEGLFGVAIDGKWGFIDATGKSVIAPQFESVDLFHEGLAVVAVRDDQKGLRYGYIDKSGRTVVPTRFVDAREFAAGRAPVQTEGPSGAIGRASEWGVINRVGEYVVPPRYDSIRGYRDGIAILCENNGLRGYRNKVLVTFVDRKGNPTGQVTANHVYDFAEGLAMVEVRERRGFVDQTGRFVLEPRWVDASSFKDGMAVVGVLPGEH